MFKAALFLTLALALSAPLEAAGFPVGDYDFSKARHRLKLSPELDEISGIVFDARGRLFAHNDEAGTVFELDPATGRIVSKFFIYEKRWFGNDPVMADFEDIAIAKGVFYLVTSSGVIYSFPGGRDGERVEARRHETFLNDLYDVEGLCYDPSTEALLLACKENPSGLSVKELLLGGKKTALGLKPVYSFSLAAMSLERAPRFLIDSDSLKAVRNGKGKPFKPSAIARHPASGHFFLLSATARMLVETDRSGRVVAATRLPKKDHPQPEGLAFSSGGDLYISNEGNGKRGLLLRYAGGSASGAR